MLRLIKLILFFTHTYRIARPDQTLVAQRTLHLANHSSIPAALCCLLYPQAIWSQLTNFACEHPEDEKLLMDTFRQQGVRSNVVSIPPGAGLPVGDAARFKEYGVIATLDEVGRVTQ